MLDPADRRPRRLRATCSGPTAPASSRRSSRSRPTARTPTSRSTSSATGISCCAIIPTWCRASPRGKYLTWEVPDPERWVPAGYAIVVVDARGTGKSPGYYELMSALQTRDVYDVDRMGRRAAVVERQGRHARRLLSGDQAMAGGGAAAAASRRDDPVGGHVRSLPRLLPPWRHLLVVLHEAVVGLADRRQPERQWREPLSRPLHRRALDRRRDRSARAAGQSFEPVRDRTAASLRRRLFHDADAAPGADHGAVPLGRKLGRARACTCAAT